MSHAMMTIKSLSKAVEQISFNKILGYSAEDGLIEHE